MKRRAEAALRKPRGEGEARGLLERLLALAPTGSEGAIYAHRHLAEINLETNPWCAALHLRDVLQARQADHVVHALMGLSQALLGNFRSAVSSYRRALSLMPRNPWYHHNLGHLLDVALATPAQAVAHLRTAHDMEPLEHEITASLAHCLATLGRREEAERLALEASELAPENADHRALLDWIRAGAKAGDGPHAREREGARGGSEGPGEAPRVDRGATAVLRALERGMREGGFTATQVARARSLWTDFRDRTRSRVQKPEVYAAAIEYAIALVQGLHGVTRASIAKRYGVTPNSLATRFEKIRDALDLSPGDPRYADVN